MNDFSFYKVNSISTPVRVDQLEKLLSQSMYDNRESSFLIRGFSKGFDMGYRGQMNRKDTSQNIPFKPGVGDEVEMWNKIMKEVKAKRFAGPYDTDSLPFKYFMQSPIGLVPKAGNQTRLIFHLSYSFKNGGKSFNESTPVEICTVKYNDLNDVVANSLRIKHGTISYAKTDLKSAFRIFPALPGQCLYLVLKARHPETKEWHYFVDLCMPFGASISCANFQRFSNALKHIVEFCSGRRFSITNYLDNFLFISHMQQEADVLVRHFLEVCSLINFPISYEKTEWGSERITFLGMLLDGVNRHVSIPEDKRVKAFNLVAKFRNCNNWQEYLTS